MTPICKSLFASVVLLDKRILLMLYLYRISGMFIILIYSIFKGDWPMKRKDIIVGRWYGHHKYKNAFYIGIIKTSGKKTLVYMGMGHDDALLVPSGFPGEVYYEGNGDLFWKEFYIRKTGPKTIGSQYDSSDE